MSTDELLKILNYIDAHICEKIVLSELAELIGYSPFYFSKLFSIRMGISVSEYVRVRKLQYAFGSLLEGKKVVEVAFMYSFESHEGFTRSFTRLFGSTPSIVKKHYSSYEIPNFKIPESRRTEMKLEDKSLVDNMHQIVFELLKESLMEAQEGHCSKIHITIFEDGTIKIADNGRGIPLTQNVYQNKQILQKIFGGYPLFKAAYMPNTFLNIRLQTINSLCEILKIIVYREGKCFEQTYVRGIEQSELSCVEMEHTPGMEIILKPDVQIFGELKFNKEYITTWINTQMVSDSLSIRINQI